MSKITTKFNPTQNGFAFTNRFSFKSKLFSPAAVKNQFIYGLCGGMCFTALDYYYHNVPLPYYSDGSKLPESFLRHLQHRQINSMPISSLLKIAANLFFYPRPDNVIKKQLELIQKSIYTGEPVPIIVIRTKGLENPTNNHQVIVYALERHNNKVLLFCYDPNHPMQETIINILDNGNQIKQSSGEPVRSLFVNKYLSAPVF